MSLCGWTKPTLAVAMVLMYSVHISYRRVCEAKFMWRNFCLRVSQYIQGIKVWLQGTDEMLFDSSYS